MLSETAVQNLEWLGDRYCREHLRDYDINELLTDQLSALWFVMASAFQRGRGFELSNRYFNHAYRVLLSRLESSPSESPRSLYELGRELGASSIVLQPTSRAFRLFPATVLDVLLS